jgi:hypothetical protein
MVGLSYLTSFSGCSFLIDEPHRKLTNINRVILIVLLLSVLVYYIQLILLQHCLLFVALRSASSCLDRSETSANFGSTIVASSSSWWDHTNLLWSCLLLCLHFYTHLIGSISTEAYIAIA